MIKQRRELETFFQGVGQAFFLDDARFGALLLAAVAAFSPRLLACGGLAALIAHAHAIRHGTPRLLRQYGLLTLNGFFFGLGMASLFRPSASFYFLLVLGALAVPLITKAVFNLLQNWRISPFMLSYILSIWMLWLACSQASTGPYPLLEASPWPHELEPLSQANPGWSWPVKFLMASLQGMGRWLFIPSAKFAALIVALLLLFSPRRCAWFLVGSFIATGVALAITGGSDSWQRGHFSSCSGLVGLALASFPERFRTRTILLYCALSVPIALATERLLDSLGLPSLSIAYVLTLWTALLSQVPKLNVSWDSKERPTYLIGSPLIAERRLPEEPREVA